MADDSPELTVAEVEAWRDRFLLGAACLRAAT